MQSARADCTPGGSSGHREHLREPELTYKNEIWRKLLHLFALSIPVGYYLLTPLTVVGFAAAGFLISLTVDLARWRDWPIQRFWRPWTDRITRPRERHTFTGASYILASAWLCPLLFSRPAAALAMTTIIVGDIAAALVGRRWGRHRFLGNRSVEGSLAFGTAATVASLMIPGVPLLAGITTAVVGMLVEAFSQRIDDNLSVPLVAGIWAHWLLLTL